MKIDTFITLGLAALTASASIQQRQVKDALSISQVEKFAPYVKPAFVENTPGKLRPGSTHTVVRYGPFSVPSSKVSTAPQVKVSAKL